MVMYAGDPGHNSALTAACLCAEHAESCEFCLEVYCDCCIITSSEKEDVMRFGFYFDTRYSARICT